MPPLKRAAAVSARIFGALADLLWPPVCAVCPRLLPLSYPPADPAAHFCLDCLEQIEYMPPELCPHCGRPYFGPVKGHFCGECQVSPPPFGSARSALLYCGSVARSIALLKYRGDLSQTRALAALTAAGFGPGERPAYDYIKPMPISRRRLVERGFNQATELARAFFGSGVGLIDEKLLIRWADGHRHQASLSGPERRRALKGHFQAADPARVRGSRILLFDDVFTTGATASEAAVTLLKAGAARVDLMTVARTVLRSWR